MASRCCCACLPFSSVRASATNLLLSSLSFTLLAFATLLFTVIIAFLQLNLTKERSELRHKINSLVDPLSGVANRRAFLEQRVEPAWDATERSMSRLPCCCSTSITSSKSTIVSAMPPGDAVLQVFADTATATLGADVLFARIGGEEFASCHAGRRYG